MPAGHAVLRQWATGIMAMLPPIRLASCEGGIRRIEETIRGDRSGHRQVGDPGLHPHTAILHADLQDPVHPGRDRAGCSRPSAGPPAKRGAGPARHHRGVEFRGHPQHRRHLLGTPWQGDHERGLAVGDQPVAFIGGASGGIVDHRIRAELLPKPGGNLRLAGDHLRVRLRHLHRPCSLHPGLSA